MREKKAVNEQEYIEFVREKEREQLITNEEMTGVFVSNKENEGDRGSEQMFKVEHKP